MTFQSPPLREYVKRVEDALPRTREALDQAFQDKYYVEKKAMKWFLIRDYFDKKLTRWEPSRTPTPLGNLVFPAPINLSSNDESSDEFLRKLDEEVAKQKGEDK